MENTTKNYEAFLLELGKLSEVCCDAMSEMRLDLYWQTLGPLMTLQEWQTACQQTMRNQKFHKVPMPAIFLEYRQRERLPL